MFYERILGSYTCKNHLHSCRYPRRFVIYYVSLYRQKRESRLDNGDYTRTEYISEEFMEWIQLSYLTWVSIKSEIDSFAHYVFKNNERNLFRYEIFYVEFFL